MLNKFLDFIGSRSPFMWLGIGFLVLIQTVQFVILISYFLSFFPVFSHVDFAASAAPTIYLSRDSQIYRLGVLFYNAMFFLIAVMGFKNTQKKRYAPIYWAILVEILVLVVLFAGLNLRFTGDHVLARPNALLGIGIFLTFASKALLKGVVCCMSGGGPEAPVQAPGVVYTKRWLCLFILISLFCVSGFFISDRHALFDAVYFWERQQANGPFLGAAYWDFSGGLPGVNGEALYGVGLPIVIGQICKLAGAFDWEMILQVLLCFIIAYTVGWFVLYTRVFRSPLLALVAWFLFLKFRLLSAEGGALLTSINWNASPIRYYGDVFFLAAISAHWSSRQRVWWIVAGCICAVQLFLVTSVGMILCLLMGIYSLMYVLTQIKSDPMTKYKAIQDALLALALCVALYGSIMLYIYAGHLAQPSFWKEFFALFKMFNNGIGNGEYINYLFIHHDILFISLGLVTLYLLSIGPAFCLTLQRQFADIRPMLAVVGSFYGLLHFQHFIFLSDPGVMGRDSAIEIFVIFIWYDIAIERIPRPLQQCLSAILLTGAVILFFNDPKWKTYPNVFHPKERFIQTVDNAYLKEYFDNTYAFAQDVQLIRRLTGPQDHVPIVSEHELMLLIKSHRAPFFYIFPLILSDQIGRTWFPQDKIYTTDRLQRTLDQIKNEKPPIIFVERKLFQAQIPASYQGRDVPLVQIVRAIMRSYAPVASSPYLVAFKRIP